MSGYRGVDYIGGRTPETVHLLIVHFNMPRRRMPCPEPTGAGIQHRQFSYFAATIVTSSSTVQLVISAKSGDSEALGVLLERYRGYLLMLAHRYLDERLRRRIDPADIVQHTFLEVQRDLAHFRGEHPAEFVSWIRNILKNNVATEVARHVTTQKRSMNREVHAPPGLEKDSQANAWLGQLPGTASSPSGKAMRAEAAMQLIESLHALPETQAEAIRLRYMEGLSLAEIVDRMGKSETAVAGLLKRGLQKLRSILLEDTL